MPTIRRTMMHRQITGAMFGEEATLVRKTTGRDQRGRAITSTQEFAIKVATNPLSPKDPRTAILLEDGTRIEDLREFFTAEDVEPKNRDEIHFDGDEYVIITTARYGSHSESVGSRKEQQQ